MVTFLVCLVVVGGAVVAILRLTLEDGREPATEAVGPHSGSRSGRLASTARRASAYLVPSEATAPGRAGTDGAAPHLLAPVGPTLGTVAIDQVLGASTEVAAAAAPEPTQRAEAVGGAHRPSSPSHGTVAVDGAGAREAAPPTGPVPAPSTYDWSEAEAGPEPHEGPAEPTGASLGTVVPDPAGTGAWSQRTSELDTVAVGLLGDGHAHPLVGDRTTATSDSVAAEPPPPERGVYAPMVEPAVTAAPVRAQRPAPRPRPSFGRRTLRRARGLVGLVVLLVVLGTVLAVTLVALAALVVVGVRAAVGT